MCSFSRAIINVNLNLSKVQTDVLGHLMQYG